MSEIEAKRKEIIEKILQERDLRLDGIIQNEKYFVYLSKKIAERFLQEGYERARKENIEHFCKYLENLQYRLNMFYFPTGSILNENYLEEINSIKNQIKELKQSLEDKKT